MTNDLNQAGVAFVTGAGGFLGGAVAAGLEREGWRVARLGNTPRGQAAAPEAPFFAGAITSELLDQAAAAFGPPELVFHAAGGASVSASIADPQTDQALTVGSLEALLDFLRAKAPAARLIYPSSAAVYGDAGSGPIKETAALRPVSPYGRHKAEAEQLILAEHALRGMRAVIVRFFSAYGPGLRKQLLWDLSTRLQAGPASLVLSGTGQEARDFLFVDDAVALITLLSASESDLAAPLIVNGGGGEAITVGRAVDAVRHALGARTAVTFSGQARAGDPKSLVADCSSTRAMGFRPATSFPAGVWRFVQWIVAESERSPR